MRKKQILVIIIMLFMIIGVIVFLRLRKSEILLDVNEFPKYKAHEHVSKDGKVIEHQHVYETRNSVITNSDVELPAFRQDPWDLIDLNVVKTDYQPYTVAEMREMWDEEYDLMHGLHHGAGGHVIELDNAYPRDLWLKRLLAHGNPIVDFWDYNSALGLRHYLIIDRKEWDVGNRVEVLKGYELSPDGTWEEYEDAVIKRRVVAMINKKRARELDPSIEGGVTFANGTFVPFKRNTVYVHISNDEPIAQFTGVKLTREQKDALKLYGIAPEGINVIYVDENNEPLPPGTPTPRFFERKMKSLEEAQTHLLLQIEYHQKMFEMDSLLNTPGERKQIAPKPHQHAEEHEPNHTHGSSHVQVKPPANQPQQRLLPNTKQLQQGMEIPSELHTQDEINRWFTELEALHGGKLPKDLQALQQVITELEKVRQDAEKHTKPPPRPERPMPEGSPTPDGDQ